jgi:hypothetical protein
MAQTKTTEQLIDAFRRRQEALATQHLQDLEVLVTATLRGEHATQHHPPSLPKRMFRGAGRLGKWFLNELLFRRSSRQQAPDQFGPEPDYASPMVIDGSYRILPPRQEGEP